MAVQLFWEISESYDQGREPSEPLVWKYDPENTEEFRNNLENAWITVERTAYELAGLGYCHAEKRAACLMLLSLVPHFRGPLNRDLISVLTYLFEIAGEYLDITRDKVRIEEHPSQPINQVIYGNLLRALLLDAESNLGLKEWDEKASRYLGFCKPHKGTRDKVWRSEWFTFINWPGKLKTTLMECNLFNVTRPDLLTLLCLYANPRYAKRLVDMGYALDDFILYIFQPVFWVENVPHTAAFDLMAPLCARAMSAHSQKRPDIRFDLAFDRLIARECLVKEDQFATKPLKLSSVALLLEMYDNKNRDDAIIKQVECAVRYLGLDLK